MKSNEALQSDVQDAIKWEPLLHAAEIGVTVKNGVVTLTGTVDNYSKKMEAGEAAKNVTGVVAVIEKIDVQFGQMGRKEDSDIVWEILGALKNNWKTPVDKIKIKVENGWVTLEGQVEWMYQKEAARASVRNQAGVKGLTNDLIVKSFANDVIERNNIVKAIERSGTIDDEDIDILVVGNKVTISGSAYSLFQKEEAGRIAWNSPGVWEVANELTVADFD